VWASRYARLVLTRCGGNKRQTCRVLDISYHTLQAYLRHPLPEDQPGSAWPAEFNPSSAVELPSPR
jgi:hypothetical protein